MNFLLIGKTKTLRESIVGSFMPLGVDILHASSYEEAERHLFEKKLGMVFVDLDVDSDVENGLLFIDEIIEEQADDLPTIVVISSHSDRQLVKDLIEKHVKAFLIKPVEDDQIVKRLLEIKKKFHYVDVDRKYYRVSPRPGEPLAIYVRSLRSSKLIKGHVKNISIGGASFVTTESVSDYDLMENDTIDKILIKFEGSDVEFKGKLLYKLDATCAVAFRHYTNYNLRILSNYIFDRVSAKS